MIRDPEPMVGEMSFTLLELSQLLARRFRVAELATFDRYEPDYDQLTQLAGFIITTLNNDRGIAEQANQLRSTQEVQS